MPLLKFISFSFFQLFSYVFFCAFLLGLFNIHFSDRNDYCVMTYMFEYPQFVRITVPHSKNYPQYGLHAYSEGRLTERARKMWFDGVPVLYLPGNSGSHMQGRSLASVALRKSLSDQYNYHFDFFTVSYNEELSGLYGGVLERQTEFASLCIKKILSLYSRNTYRHSVPNSVILIGHSMGGLIAKRLLAHRDTFNMTNLAVTLATPLEAPIINFDISMNDYYMQMHREWHANESTYRTLKEEKVLLSFGNGMRDVLIPSSLTGSEDSDISVLTTAVPGAWVSPDHVSIVWCKQIVMAINRFLFSIVNQHTEQISTNKSFVISKAREFFVANRSMYLNPEIPPPNAMMTADAFWYEDNRAMYQISRPDIDKLTYLMIRLVNFPHNRFVAIEAINLDDKDWLFGCNAKYTYANHRYCKSATSLAELSRWTGAATNFGKRKLATIHLHDLIKGHPDWTHVIVKVSQTRKPVTLNIDINDLASRQVTVNLPSIFSFGQNVIIQETQQNALYYELLLPGVNLLHHSYLLYIEPTSTCKAKQYHVSAELHAPWANNYEYFHYYTELKQSPMKIRLHRSNPNTTNNLNFTEHVKITVLLDPRCTYTISISPSRYHQLAQLARNYLPLLFPYAAAIVLLATRSNIVNMRTKGECMSIHGAFMSNGVKPYYILVITRLGAVIISSVPVLGYIFEMSSWKNSELQYFSRSLLIVPVYMAALGMLNVIAIVIIIVMVCSSQLAHRLLLRIIWRGGSAFTEKVASALQKIPSVVSAALSCAVPVSCGAASLTAGAAFYAFMLSKRYEEYLEDYVYMLMSIVVARIRCFFKKPKSTKEPSEPAQRVDQSSVPKENPVEELTDKAIGAALNEETESSALVPSNEGQNTGNESTNRKDRKVRGHDGDDQLGALNFHMMMFFLWLTVTLVNVPALLTWARNFKYSAVLKPDTSYYTGIIMSVCAGFIWQVETPRKNLKHYEVVSQILFVKAVLLIVLAPFALYCVNYIATGAFVLITLQQLFDQEEPSLVNASTDEQTPAAEVNAKEELNQKDNIDSKTETDKSDQGGSSSKTETDKSDQGGSHSKTETDKSDQGGSSSKTETDKSDQGGSHSKTVTDKSDQSGSNAANENTDAVNDPHDPSNENSVYNIFKSIKEKFSANENL